MKRHGCYLAIILALLLSGCAHQHYMPQAPVTPVSQTRILPAFYIIKTKGDFNITLHTGFKKSAVILKGLLPDIMSVKIQVKNNILFIEKLSKNYGPIHVDIQTRAITAFNYSGVGFIDGAHLHTEHLNLLLDNAGRTTLRGNIGLQSLIAQNSGYTEIYDAHSKDLRLKISDAAHVKIVGKINVSKIDMQDRGKLSIFWVNNCQLAIQARDNTYLQLGGVAKTLDLEVWGNAHFNGRYLRATNAFIKTHDHSIAEISTVKHQHTLATDASDISFYNLPATRTDFMAYNGAVLDERDFCSSWLQEHTEFNK